MSSLQKNIRRKDFFRECWQMVRELVAEAIPMEKTPRSTIYLLPPGAPSPEQFLDKCTQCYECVAQCAHYAIQVCRDEKSPYFGYPVVEPRRQACYMCPDFPCISACSQGVLELSGNTVKLGVAVIRQNQCLDYQQGFCQTCLNNCPKSGKAIFRNASGKLEISSQYCDGCGMCVMVCVLEEPAIYILPTYHQHKNLTTKKSPLDGKTPNKGVHSCQ